MPKHGSLPSISDLTLVHEGEFGEIRLGPNAVEEYEDVQKGATEDAVRTKAQMKRYFAAYCSEKIPRLNSECYKKQDDFGNGFGSKLAVFEFKSYQWRLYGVVTNLNGKRVFVGLRVDPAKKQDKANRALLGRVAEDAGQYKEFR